MEVVASKIYGEGKFYVAVTRARSLGMLKISGLEATTASIRRVARSSWRALYWMRDHGEVLPPAQETYATTMKHQYNLAFQ